MNPIKIEDQALLDAQNLYQEKRELTRLDIKVTAQDALISALVFAFGQIPGDYTEKEKALICDEIDRQAVRVEKSLGYRRTNSLVIRTTGKGKKMATVWLSRGLNKFKIKDT